MQARLIVFFNDAFSTVYNIFRHITGLLGKSELENTWKNVVVACFKLLPHHFSWRNKKKHRNPLSGERVSEWRYETENSRMLTTHPRRRVTNKEGKGIKQYKAGNIERNKEDRKETNKEEQVKLRKRKRNNK
jgi:hypothetical protein